METEKLLADCELTADYPDLVRGLWAVLWKAHRLGHLGRKPDDDDHQDCLCRLWSRRIRQPGESVGRAMFYVVFDYTRGRRFTTTIPQEDSRIRELTLGDKTIQVMVDNGQAQPL